MTNGELTFPFGAELTVIRDVVDNGGWDKMDRRKPQAVSHTIGPCSISESTGSIAHDGDNAGKWVGTVTVTAPPGSDITAFDRVQLPNGSIGVVSVPPVTPTNPFTGWSPFTQFTLSTPGVAPKEA